MTPFFSSAILKAQLSRLRFFNIISLVVNCSDLDHALGHHRIGDFHETGDIGSGNQIVAETVLFLAAAAPSWMLIIMVLSCACTCSREYSVSCILSHLMSGNAAGIGSLAGTDDDSVLIK